MDVETVEFLSELSTRTLTLVNAALSQERRWGLFPADRPDVLARAERYQHWLAVELKIRALAVTP